MQAPSRESSNQHGNFHSGGWMLLIAGGLVLAVGLVYFPVLGCGFVGLDDGNNIFLNPDMGGLSWERLSNFMGNFHSARRSMPVGWLGFSVVFTWQGLEPAGYHAASLAWHALATVGLFLASHNILRLRSEPASGAGYRALVAAGLVAALWALHPLRTEVVAWASGLLYSQAAALAFLAVWLWTLRWSAASRSGWYAGGAALALTLSLLTYPLALGVPVVCWLLDRLHGHERGTLADPRATRAGRLSISWGVVVLCGVAMAVLLTTLVSRQAAAINFAAMPSLGNFSWFERGIQALYVWGYDLVVFVLPTDLAPVYTTLYQLSPAAPRVYVMAGAGLVGLLAVIVLARHHPGLAGWALAYSALALPVLGLTEHPWITHDRYTGLLHPVLAVGAFHWLRNRNWARHFYPIAGLVMVVILAAACQARSLIGIWADPWSHLARLEQTLPRDAWAGYYLGNVSAGVLFLDGRFERIDPALDRAESLAPGWSAAPVRAEFAGLIRQHREFTQKGWPDHELAPLAVLHYLHGKSFQERKDWFTARAHFQAAVRASAGFAEAGLEEAWCALELNQPLAARQRLEQVIASPGSLAFGAREQSFWRLLAAVHRARGEMSLETATLTRARERMAVSLKP
ncbi:MAG: hypothetical protein PSV13_12770 [Lacunisphaera sp.]|nr:hypothetical protein [Lacunisphaera sp.]